MSDIDEQRAEQQAWQPAGAAAHASRYSDVVKRYLAATGYAAPARSSAPGAPKKAPGDRRPGGLAVCRLS
jgi:hypothetical protein